MKPAEAKKLMAAELQRLDVPYFRLSARTINFSDLARSSCVFVTIHGFLFSQRMDTSSHEVWQELKDFAVKHGFRIEAH